MSAMAEYLAQAATRKAQSGFCHWFDALLAALAAGDTVVASDQAVRCDGALMITHAQAVKGAVAPIVVWENQLWLHRIWQKERDLTRQLLARIHAPLRTLPEKLHLPESLKTEQRQAILHGLSHRLTIINGGPGTGKTYTIAQLVAAMAADNPALRIALAAPTGKAAKRMEESLRQALAQNDAQSEKMIAQLESAKTLHRLLAIARDGVAGYDHDNPLAADVVIVDEASMLSLELAQMLFSALKDEAILILLGDAHQLAAVEPGAVLHDLVAHPALAEAVVTLRGSSRFARESGIGQLAEKVLAGESENLRKQLRQWPDVRWRAPGRPLYDQLFAGYQSYFDALTSAESSPETLLACFDQFRILCASHYGPLGKSEINRQLRYRHLQAQGERFHERCFQGLPIMIVQNDYDNQLFNGDIGLCLDDGQGLEVYFPGREQPVALSRLNPQTLTDAYAMTIHKSQGSEFAEVALLLDNQQEKGLSRELLYTGLTRTKSALQLIADWDGVKRAIDSPARRTTGLGLFLEE